MNVVVAIISNTNGELLVTQRSPDKPHGGCWEFPGGKVEADEPPEAALIREIKEEVGIHIHQHTFLGNIQHSYTDKAVDLHVYKILAYSGEARCLEGQLALQWVKPDQLQQLSFPEANYRIIELISETCLSQQQYVAENF